jgi:hypothetical protein
MLRRIISTSVLRSLTVVTSTAACRSVSPCLRQRRDRRIDHRTNTCALIRGLDEATTQRHSGGLFGRRKAYHGTKKGPLSGSVPSQWRGNRVEDSRLPPSLQKQKKAGLRSFLLLF